jgi:hypothetical protein
MTTTDTSNRSTEQYRAALTAKLEAWVTHLPPQEQDLLTRALNRVAANREDAHGYGGAGGGTWRSGALVELATTFLPLHDAPPGSALDQRPFESKPGIKRGIDVPGGGPSVSGGSDDGDA